MLMGRDQALYQKTGEVGHIPAASWETLLLRIDTHKRPMRTQLPDSGSRELRRAVRENTKELDRVEGVVIPSWRTTLRAEPPRAEVEETVKLVKGKGKQMVFRLQVKGKGGQPFCTTRL